MSTLPISLEQYFMLSITIIALVALVADHIWPTQRGPIQPLDTVRRR